MHFDPKKMIRIDNDYLLKIVSPTKMSNVDLSRIDDVLKVQIIDIRKDIDHGIYTLGDARLKFFNKEIILPDIFKVKKRKHIKQSRVKQTQKDPNITPQSLQ